MHLQKIPLMKVDRFSLYLTGEVGQQAVWAAEVNQELWQILPANTLDPNNYPIFNARGYSHERACTVRIMVGVGDDAAVVTQSPGAYHPDVGRKPVAI